MSVHVIDLDQPLKREEIWILAKIRISTVQRFY